MLTAKWAGLSAAEGRVVRQAHLIWCVLPLPSFHDATAAPPPARALSIWKELVAGRPLHPMDTALTHSCTGELQQTCAELAAEEVLDLALPKVYAAISLRSLKCLPMLVATDPLAAGQPMRIEVYLR